MITCTLEGDINTSTLAKYYQEQQKVGEEWVKCAEDLKKLSADRVRDLHKFTESSETSDSDDEEEHARRKSTRQTLDESVTKYDSSNVGGNSNRNHHGSRTGTSTMNLKKNITKDQMPEV